jgi:hypothetical protein
MDMLDDLHVVQEELDYWMSEGGSPEELERLIVDKIKFHTMRITQFEQHPEAAMHHVRHIEVFFNGLTALRRWRDK